VALAVFFVVNSILLNVVLAVLPWTPQGKTVFNYTARAIIGRAQSDSWGQMHIALEEFRAHPEAPLYDDVFFRRHIRFPYAPPSLLLTSMVERLPANEFAVLHFLSWLVFVATVLITVRLFRRAACVRPGDTALARRELHPDQQLLWLRAARGRHARKPATVPSPPGGRDGAGRPLPLRGLEQTAEEESS